MTPVLNYVFSALWLLLGSDPSVPAREAQAWHWTGGWQQDVDRFTFSAESTEIPASCRKQPEAYVDFPLVINGAHEITFDGRPAVTFSDSSFKRVRSIYGKPSLPCEKLAGVTTLGWLVATDTKYFARFALFPQVEATHPLDNLFNETLNVVAAGTLLVMAVFCLIIFMDKLSKSIAISYFLSNIFLSIYFATSVPGLLSVDMDMQTLHRLGDTSLGVGFVLLYYVLASQGLVGRRVFATYLGMSVLVFALQLGGRTSDEIQMGTNLGFLPVLFVLLAILPRLFSHFRKRTIGRLEYLELTGLALFVGGAVNDILVVSGDYDGYLVLPIAIVAKMMFLALGVHESILEAYRERDYLRANLEKEVERKTLELRQTQAELVHSAKLASLGTLSAGIAHEINNSINFVNGAIPPLEKLIAKLEHVSPRDLEIGRKLLAAVKDGVNITVDIVKSLRQFTGLNQAKFKDVRLPEVVHSVTTILNSKIKERYTVVTEMPTDLQIYGDVVSINQILMNLITNAMDAMPEGGTITVAAEHTSAGTVVEIRDTGCGIPEDIQSRIFDPFFTTKDVGHGTGLGLYIISNEMKKYGGLIAVSSKPGAGTTFRLTFPEQLPQEQVAA